MTDQERLGRLEEKVSALDRDIETIRKEQEAVRMRNEKSALDAESLKGQLISLIDALKGHQKWHDKNSEKKYKVTDIILALGMLAVTFMEFMKK
jgi:molecular chaperone GrpE (heat shock protein)